MGSRQAPTQFVPGTAQCAKATTSRLSSVIWPTDAGSAWHAYPRDIVYVESPNSRRAIVFHVWRCESACGSRGSNA
jgi:hypothetical protein